MTLQVFISYKSEYREFARAVKSELNQWGFATWLDVDNIQPGDYFRHKIQEGLDSSDVLLMVLTEEAQRSREVMAEVDYFLDVNKPVVPLRHREFKPLYIFVSIQYIDFVADQANGFVQLKHRLNELAQSTAPVISEAESKPEPAAEQEAPKTDDVILDDFLQEESDQKKEVVEDGIFGGDDLSSAEAPKPAQPILQPPPSPITQPAAPPQSFPKPQRQAEYLPQPSSSRSKSNRTLLWPLAAAASLIVVGAAVLVSTNAMLSTSQSPTGTSPLVWVIGGLVVVGAAGYAGWRRFGRSESRKGLTPSPTEDAANRATMLQKVEDFWLKGVLDPALEAGTFEMGLSSAPGAVLRHKDYGDYELPANANILDVFNDLNRELLILGAPGGGKTVLMLQLAKELITQARNPTPQSPPRKQGEEPIPVVFNLSSWAAERKPLADWLVGELRQKYQVPKKVATAWVEGEKLLLLLDGLDEVAEQYRNDCVDAINSFRQKYRTVDLAICSRIVDYDALARKLDVRGAIVLEPLSQSVIDKYLDQPDLASLQQAVETDQELRQMSQVPFLLNAMAYAYAGATPTSLQFPTGDESLNARRTHLFDRWVEKRLVARPSLDYPASKVWKWLGWLARNMHENKESVFYKNDIAVSWLTRNKYIYWIGIVCITGIIGGLAYSISFGKVSGMLFGTAYGLTRWLMRKTKLRTVSVIVIIAALIAIFGDLIGVKTISTVSNAISTALICAFFGPIIGIFSVIFVFVSAFLIKNFGKYKELNKSTASTSNQNSSEKRSPLSLKSHLSFALGGLILGSSIGLIFGAIFFPSYSIQIGLTCGIFTGIHSGGEALINYGIIRLIIFYNKDMSWNYARFLDYCASVGIMRKVGGGYIFAHRYLLEYFAELDQ